MDQASGDAAPHNTPSQSPGPGVLQVLDLPARPEEGGEWELLLANVKAWWTGGEPQALWQRLSKPLGGGLTLVLVLLVLQVYGAVVGTLESLPLLPGLLELVGLIWVVRHGVPRLLRSRDRNALLTDLNGRWKAFRGLS